MSVANISQRSKKMTKWPADLNNNGTKNLKNRFPNWSKNPDNQRKQTQAQLIFEKDQNNKGEAR